MAYAIHFPGANFVFKAPEGRDDIGDLHTFRQPGGTADVSCWQFTNEELADIARTGCAFLAVMSGDSFYPMFVGSEDAARSVVADFGPLWERGPAPPAFHFSSNGGLLEQMKGDRSIALHLGKDETGTRRWAVKMEHAGHVNLLGLSEEAMTALVGMYVQIAGNEMKAAEDAAADGVRH